MDPALNFPTAEPLTAQVGISMRFCFDKPTFTAFSFVPHSYVWIVGAATLLLGVSSFPWSFS